jgi:hypothetical protein
MQLGLFPSAKASGIDPHRDVGGSRLVLTTASAAAVVYLWPSAPGAPTAGAARAGRVTGAEPFIVAAAVPARIWPAPKSPDWRQQRGSAEE